MKKFIIIPFLLFCLNSLATDYFIKTAGNDSNTGLSDGQAWQTISKVNSFWSSGNFNAGDRILFNRGDTFYGTIVVAESGSSTGPMIIGSYGSGNLPVISAFTTISGWSNEGGGVYSKTLSVASAPNVVAVDGVNTPMGRYPDNTRLSIDAHVGGTSITDAALPSTPDWDGAEVVIQKNAWIIDRCQIISHVGNTITMTNPSGYPWPNYSLIGNWYFIQNDRETLTTFGEWYYGGGKFYMYFGAVDPTSVVVQVSTLNQNINITGRNYIMVTSLDLQGANQAAVYVSASDYVTVQECNIQFCGDAGIDGAHSGGNSSLQFKAITNTISQVQNQGVILGSEFDGALINGNTLDSIGMLPGHNFSGDGQNNGIKLYGSNHVIEYNRLANMGYNGIDFGGNNVKVRYNYINGFGKVKWDVGGIYTTCFTTLWTGREIYGNIVLNGDKGVYADQREANISIYGNTIYSCQIGIYLHNTHESSVTNNMIYKCYNTALWVQHDKSWPNDPTRNLTINNNDFVSLGPPTADNNQYGTRWHFYTDVNQNYNFGTADNNVVCRFLGETGTLFLLIKISGVNFAGPHLTLEQWKTNSGQDQHSTGNLGGTVTSESQVHFIYNSTRVNKTFSLSSQMTDVRGKIYPVGNITLSPFTSKLLIGNGKAEDNEDPGDLPSVLPSVQNFVVSITETTAIIGGDITNAGDSPVIDRGLCWATTINPTTASNVTHNGTGTGSFTQMITGLTKATTYYVRAFATNSAGTSYSSNLIFRTPGVGEITLLKNEGEFANDGTELIRLE